jgi:hypothetical protein
MTMMLKWHWHTTRCTMITCDMDHRTWEEKAGTSKVPEKYASGPLFHKPLFNLALDILILVPT